MKNKILLFTKILYGCISGGLIPVIALIELAPDFKFTIYFTLTYVAILLFSLFYIPIVTLHNSKKVKKEFLIKCIKQFILSFIVMIIFNSALDFMFNKFNFLHVLFQSCAFAFGLNFIDIIFLKKDNIN